MMRLIESWGTGLVSNEEDVLRSAGRVVLFGFLSVSLAACASSCATTRVTSPLLPKASRAIMAHGGVGSGQQNALSDAGGNEPCAITALVGASEPLRDGGVYAARDVEVSIEGQMSVDRPSWVWVDGAVYSFVDGVARFELPEGVTEAVCVCVSCADGTNVRMSFSRVIVDTQVPCIGAAVDGMRIEDGGIVRSSGALTIELEDATLRLLDGVPDVTMRLVDAHGSQVDFGTWVPGPRANTFVASSVGALQDGTYDLSVCASDACGASTTLACSFIVDTQVPEVHVDGLGEAAACVGGRWYFDRTQTVAITVADACLDTARTTVCGRSLAELLVLGRHCEGGASFVPWEVTTDARGRRTYSCVVTFDEGTYDLPLVRAVDAAGNEACDVHRTEQGEVNSMTLDTTAPFVVATVSAAPRFVAQGSAERGAVAFFGEDVSLVFSIVDEGGIADVKLLDDERNPCGYELADVAPDLSGARVALGKRPFTDGVVVEVRDHAGNRARWSLAPLGDRMVAQSWSTTTNEPLTCADTGELVSGDGHPAKLVRDVDAPMLALTGIPEDGYATGPIRLALEATDDNLGFVATQDAGQQILCIWKGERSVDGLSVGYANARESDREHVYGLSLGEDAKAHEADGVYRVQARLTDLVGNTSKELTTSFVMDTAAPRLRVSLEGDLVDTKDDKTIFARKPCAFIVSVEDRNFSPDHVKVAVEVEGGDGKTRASVGDWEQGGEPDIHTCVVTLPADGSYRLRVFGTDAAGNRLEGTSDTPVVLGCYVSRMVTVDTQAPQVSFSYADQTPQPCVLDGVDYFRHPVRMNVTIQDRNLDTRATYVVDSQGREHRPNWRVRQPDVDGQVVYEATITYVEEEKGGRKGLKEPYVHAQDVVGLIQDVKRRFVVDQSAPCVEVAKTFKTPQTYGSQTGDAGLYWFYNELDGVPAALTFVVSDAYALDGAWVEDPDGAYDITFDNQDKDTRQTIVLALRDAASQGVGHDVELGRDVRLFVRDVAGNVRWWSLDRMGRILADHAEDATNVSIDGLGIYPTALVKDTTPPVVRIEGIEAGAYYDKTQTAHVVVDEYCFDHLVRFDPHRVAVTVETRGGRADAGQSTRTRAVAEFVGSRPFFTLDERFEADGHYRVRASVTDLAGNRSREVVLEEFTIDKSAPVILVGWDNTDVHNGMYYHAPRTATITVTEHNFDASLMEVSSTGIVSNWTSEGDTHTCKVSFVRDASGATPHTLVVRGHDRAGNEASPYVEPAFAIDTKPPTVSFVKRVSGQDPFSLEEGETMLMDGSAFAHGFVPIVELRDEANFDPAGVDVRLEGKRGLSSRDAGFTRNVTPCADGGVRVDWGNLGLEDNDGQPSFFMGADDVYTITARVIDKAGNDSREQSVTFSVNRYGSNFFVERLGEPAQAQRDAWTDVPLSAPPHIVVHEVNVSGAPDEASEQDCSRDHVVTKEYANATSEIAYTAEAGESGYTLASSTKASVHNPYEGWTEFVYDIGSGNFGAGSSSDHGDGGQGLYRVDVSSLDKAQNHNTTAAYWESGVERDGGTADAARDDMPCGKTATVTFTLDEFGPKIMDLDLPHGLVVGHAYEASFRVADAITRGNRLDVRVDGEPVAVYREGSSMPVAADELVSPGRYRFLVSARPATAAREIAIRVADYTGLDERSQSVHVTGFVVSTLVVEALVTTLILGLAMGVCSFMRRRADLADRV